MSVAGVNKQTCIRQSSEDKREITNGKDILDLNLLQEVFFGGEELSLINNLTVNASLGNVQF